MPSNTHIRCLKCQTVWLRADLEETLDAYLQHSCNRKTEQQNHQHPSLWREHEL